MRILITGGAGFIGSHLADALLQKGHEITILDNLSSGTKKFIPKDAEFIEMDIRSDAVLPLFESHHFDIVYHEAAQTMVPASVDDPKHDADENIMGLLTVLEAARKTGVTKIIFSSSAAIYGDNLKLPLVETEPAAPTSFYGLTKATTESYLSLYHSLFGLDYTVLRYSNVYGPRQGANGEGGVIYLFAQALAQKKKITILGNGLQTRDFISVHDVVAANVAALDKGSGSTCNVSTSTEITIRDLAMKMLHLSSLDDSYIEYGPAREGDIFRSSLSNKRAQELLHWKPQISLEKGLQDTLEFFLA